MGKQEDAARSDAESVAPDVTGRVRVIVENVSPAVDGGRFPVKRVVGDTVDVTADIFTDGHDELTAILLYRSSADGEWVETPMSLDVNDRWLGAFALERIGTYEYTISAWVDPFKSWAAKLRKRVAADQDTAVDLEMGAIILEEVVHQASGHDADRLRGLASALRLKNHTPRLVTSRTG